MITLNYIIGKEAVEILDEDFDDFKEYYKENPDCLHSRQFETEKDMKQFIAGLEESGYENYSILDEEEVKILEAEFV